MAVAGHSRFADHLGQGYMPMTYGAVQLAIGTQTEVLSVGMANDHTPNAQPLITRKVPGGGIGHLSATWNQATRTITFTSSDNTETSTVGYCLVG